MVNKMCKQCNKYTKHLVLGLCKKCYDKQHYENNKEKWKQYYKNNKEKIKQYLKDNKEKIKKQKKQHYGNNKEKVKQQVKQRRIKNNPPIKKPIIFNNIQYDSYLEMQLGKKLSIIL